MKALIKVVLGLVVVLIIAVVVVGAVFDPNDYKAEIQQLARDKASIDLSIDGDIGWSIFPTLGLQLPKVNAKSLEGKQLAAVNQVQVAVKLTSLLQGKVEMNGVLVDGLVLAVTAPAEGTDKGDHKGSDKGQDKSGSGGVQFDIGDVDIRNANITLDDPAQGRKVVLTDFNFSGKGVASATPFPASMNFNLDLYQGGSSPASSLKMKLETELFLDLVNNLFKVSGLNLALNIKNEALGDKAQDLNIKGDIVADLAADQLQLQSLVVEIANLVLKADLDVKQISGKPQLSGKLDVAPFDANQLLETLGKPRVETSDAEALKKVAFTTRLEGPANTLVLKDLKLQLDDTTFNGEISYNLGTGAQVVKLQGDTINVDRYLPPKQEQPAAESTGSAKSGERYPKTPLFPLEVLKTLNLVADIGLDQLQASGLTISALQLQTEARGGLVKVSKIAGQLYEGSFNNSATIDARKDPISLKINKNVSQVQLGGMLKDLADKDVFSGLFNMKGSYQASGNSIYDIVHSLDGNMDLSLKDGRLQGVNLVDKLCSGLLQLQGKTPDPTAATNYTEFSNLSGSVKIVKGVMDNQDLKAALAGVNLGGAGTVDLPKEALDYGLSLTILQELKGPNCQIDNKLHNLSFPVRCTGGFDDDPAKMCGPDKKAMNKVLADLGAAEVKAKAKAKVDAVKTETKEKLESKLKGKLKGLFN
ncbi:MAG: AsmA family protein [Motiliproteus sp.]